MEQVIFTAIYLTLPLALAGTLHMVVVKLDLLPFLKIPVNEKLFGSHKTWRGFIAMIAFSILSVWLFTLIEDSPMLYVHLSEFPAVALGAALGLGYTLPELPNSWWKRRMGITPGKLPEKNRFFFFLLDHFDSTLGCAIVFALFGVRPMSINIAVLFIGPVIHTTVSLLLWVFRLRKEPI